MTVKSKFVFIILFVLAALTRLLWLDSLPPSLNWDEISHGYNAYSLLNTGADQWGQKLPIFNFRAYGDYPTTLYMYLAMPFIKLFGLNALSVRLPSALLGIGIVFLLPLVVTRLLNSPVSKKLTLILALTSPFLIFTSRAVYQSTPALFLLLLSFYFFFTPKKFVWGLIPLFLSLFAYHNTRLISPLILLVILFFNRRRLILKSLSFPLILFYLGSLVVYSQLLFGPAAARSRWVGIITPTSINTINNLRNNSRLPSPLPRLVYNKPTFFATTFTKNIVSYLNPIPLFITGSGHYQFNLPNFGLYYPILLPFFYLGLIFFVLNWRQPASSQTLVLFLVSLIPAALTTGDFPSLRLVTALPFYFVFIIKGLEIFFSRISGFPKSIFLIALFFSFVFFIYRYVYVFPRAYAFAWQDGYSQLVSTLKPLYPRYQNIYITKKYGEPHQFLLFYWPIPPKSFQSNPNLNWDYHADWYWVNAFDKFVFYNDWEIPTPPPSSLLVTSSPLPESFGLQLLKVVTATNGQPAFYLYEH
jgi:4-amino-4-deoxy-L-arabinose transferase-like glycosyltransferase